MSKLPMPMIDRVEAHVWLLAWMSGGLLILSVIMFGEVFSIWRTLCRVGS